MYFVINIRSYFHMIFFLFFSFSILWDFFWNKIGYLCIVIKIFLLSNSVGFVRSHLLWMISYKIHILVAFTSNTSWSERRTLIHFHYSGLEFKYSEKAAKFCEIFPLLLTAVHLVKSKGKISHNFGTFSE